MFNGRFNWLRFNVSETGKAVKITSHVSETIGAALGAGKRVSFRNAVSEKVGALSCLVIGLPVAARIKEEIGNGTNGMILIYFRSAGKEAIQNRSYSGKRMEIAGNVVCTIKGKTHLGKRMRFLSVVQSVVNNVSYSGKRIQASDVLTDAIQCQVSSYIIDKQIVQVNVTIPPGGKLIIDSENYNVFLDEANIIYLHQGDWPTLDRETFELAIDTGTGGILQGKMVYKEAYL